MAKFLDPMETPCILCGKENHAKVLVYLSLCEGHEDDDINAAVGGLRTQVARLEGEKAALREALLRVTQLIDCREHAFGQPEVEDGEYLKSLHDTLPQSHAALSDTGEGQLPPEVREQVLKTGRALLDWIGRSPLEPFEGDRVLYSMGLEEDFRAALDALEVKR